MRPSISQGKGKGTLNPHIGAPLKGRADIGKDLPMEKEHWRRRYNGTVGTLYLVATPIGNLEDITLRALRVLEQVPLIAAEDTRTTRKILGSYNIKTPVTSYNEHTRKSKAAGLLEVLKTSDIALVSDAGTPVISDPGRSWSRWPWSQGSELCPCPVPAPRHQPCPYPASLPISTSSRASFPVERRIETSFSPR